MKNAIKNMQRKAEVTGVRECLCLGLDIGNKTALFYVAGNM